MLFLVTVLQAAVAHLGESNLEAGSILQLAGVDLVVRSVYGGQVELVGLVIHPGVVAELDVAGLEVSGGGFDKRV